MPNKRSQNYHTSKIGDIERAQSARRRRSSSPVPRSRVGSRDGSPLRASGSAHGGLRAGASGNTRGDKNTGASGNMRPTQRVTDAMSQGRASFDAGTVTEQRTGQYPRARTASGAYGSDIARDRGTRGRVARGRVHRAQGDINVSRKRRVLPIILGIVLVLALLAGVAYAYARVTGAFPITSVEVSGADHLTEAEVSALAQIPEDTTLLTVDAAGIRNRLMMDAWVRDANVVLQPPNSLVITVSERQIDAVVEMKSVDSSTTTNWALSTDGMWLMPIPDRDSDAGKNTSAQVYEDADAAIHIVNVPYSTNPQIGQYCTDSNVQNAINILSGMTTDLRDQVKSVSATDAESTTLLLDGGVEIAFGTATDIRTKERVCLEILKEHEGDVAYINVRTVSKPTWRAAS